MKAFKTLILTAALVCGGIMTANAQLGGGQKIVYVDSEYIMENIPEYGDAQEELNALSEKWQKEVKAIYDKVSEMYSKYQTEMLLLSEDQKRAREQAIVDKEQEAKNLQMQYFGAEGQLYQKRTELIQPIQEKVYTAMKEVAQTKNYAFILDLASGTSVLYASDKNDVSDDVLTLVIKDHGAVFDPTQHEEVDIDAELDERAIGGLGIHLIRTIMDTVEYQRTSDGYNRLVLTKRIEELKN